MHNEGAYDVGEEKDLLECEQDTSDVWESTDDEDPMATFVHEIQDWDDEERVEERNRVTAPFCAFFLSTKSSEDVARTRRWSSSRPMRPRVSLIPSQSVSVVRGGTYPANTPPARTRAMLIAIFAQNSGDPIGSLVDSCVRCNRATAIGWWSDETNDSLRSRLIYLIT